MGTGISDIIASFIYDLIEREEGCAEMRRAELAQRFGCVPSQINYVISTRFTPEYGYIVESRRGGGGYIRIRRACLDPKQIIMHAINGVGDEISGAACRAILLNLIHTGAVCQITASLISAAISDSALKCLPVGLRDIARASVLKQMLVRTQLTQD